MYKKYLFVLNNCIYLIKTIKYEKNEIIYKDHIHIGIATDTDKGLFVPVIKHANSHSILSLANEIKTLSSKTAEGRLTKNDMSGGTSEYVMGNMSSAAGNYTYYAAEVYNTIVYSSDVEKYIDSKYTEPKPDVEEKEEQKEVNIYKEEE